MNDQNLVLWAIDENMGTNLQAFYKHFYIGCLKTQKQQLHLVKIKYTFFLFSINFFCWYSVRARVNQAGRKPVRAGRSALRNMPSWNTVYRAGPIRHRNVFGNQYLRCVSSLCKLKLLIIFRKKYFVASENSMDELTPGGIQPSNTIKN